MTKKVLLIEDSPTDAQIVKDLLSRKDIEISIAGTGGEGLKAALELKPDLILLDIMLPDMNGFDVCSRIRQMDKIKNTIVVILSIKNNPSDITKAFHAGADDYVVKPAEPEFLVKKLLLYMGMRQIN